MYQEPIKMIGEGEYNLDTLKEIKVTDSYLGLDQHIKECQNEEAFYACTTRNFKESALEKCGCLPLSLILNKVYRTYS